MNIWLFISSTVYALGKLVRQCLGDQDHGPENETSERDHLLGSHSQNTSVTNSSCEINYPQCQSDRTQIKYYDCYPNLPSSSTTKRYSAVSFQSESVNKSMEGTNKVSPTSKPSFPKPASASSKPFLSPNGPLASPSSPKPSIPSYSSFSRPASSSFSQSLTSPAAPPFTSDQPRSSATPSPSSCGSSASPKAPQSSKPTLSPLSFNPTNKQMKANYTWVQKETSLIYMVPKNIECLIKKDIVPDVLKKPLSPSTYKDYFAALLYAEDIYIEKWSDFQLLNVTLKLQQAAIYDKSVKNKYSKKKAPKDDKIFVAFEMDSVPERRPFLLSRDFVYARRSGGKAEEFQGILYRVVKSTTVLVEFEEDFYSHHLPKNRYDISFSFNRVCLKRAHQAIAAASGSVFKNYIFPDYTTRKNVHSSATYLYSNYNLESNSNSAVRRILSLEGQPPYLIEGPLCVTSDKLSKTGFVVRETVLEIYKKSSKCRILVCAPINRTGDVLMRSLKKEIPESDMFRANAAFREVDGVPVDILPLCLYEGGECFSFPSLGQLRQFKVIFSTFVSSIRLHNEGLSAGHFSHIFLVDTSSATEPETMIALTSLANENTTVIVTGAPYNRTSWVRSDVARKYGLRMSYFERLRATKTYSSSDPMFITLV